MFHKWFVAFWFLVIAILVAVSISAAIFEKESATTYDVGDANTEIMAILKKTDGKVNRQIFSVRRMIAAANTDIDQVRPLVGIWCSLVDEQFGIE